jgi:hypothetical protein
MIVNGPQNVYNPLQKPEGQGNITRPDLHRPPKPENTSDSSREEQQAQPLVQDQVDVSITDTKDLSRFYNAYRSYVHQISATDTMVDKIMSGVSGLSNIVSVG